MQNIPYVDLMGMHPAVTGSCNLGVCKFPDGQTLRFVGDCGLFHEKEYDEYNRQLPFNAENVGFALVTHNHVDHTGRLPFMVKNGFYNPIYTTETTAKFLPLALNDSYKVLKDVSKRKNRKPLYNEEDVARAIELVKPVKFNETFKVSNNVKLTFLKNGHLLGAAMILVQITYPGEEDINVLFTGDYNNKNIFFDVDPVPEWILDLPLTIVQESTYGNMDSTEIEKCFEKNVFECVNNGGSVIAPVFSLGRSQEILYVLQQMQRKDGLSTDIPIYLDGKLALRYTDLYLHDGLDIKPEMRDFIPQNLHFVNKDTRAEVLSDTNAKIVLTTSGMGSYGPAQVYIPEYIGRKNALIHFTGYTAEGTLGRRLKDAMLGDTIEMGGVLVKKRAEVQYTSEYSAHAKADEMIEFLKQFRNLKLVLVNHGEPGTKEIFAERIMEEVAPKRVGILGRDFFFRINHYGFVKSLSTKFE